MEKLINIYNAQDIIVTCNKSVTELEVEFGVSFRVEGNLEEGGGGVVYASYDECLTTSPFGSVRAQIYKSRDIIKAHFLEEQRQELRENKIFVGIKSRFNTYKKPNPTRRENDTQQAQRRRERVRQQRIRDGKLVPLSWAWEKAQPSDGSTYSADDSLYLFDPTIKFHCYGDDPRWYGDEYSFPDGETFDAREIQQAAKVALNDEYSPNPMYRKGWHGYAPARKGKYPVQWVRQKMMVLDPYLEEDLDLSDDAVDRHEEADPFSNMCLGQTISAKHALQT